MKLTMEQQDILNGGKGDVLRKTMETLVRYGEVYGADTMVSLDGAVHLVCSFSMAALKPFLNILESFVEEGIEAKMPFTVDPRPMDFDNLSFEGHELEERVYHAQYSTQQQYEEILKKIGLKDEHAFTCACYFDEVGNTPSYGQNLAWAESSAVVYANSVLGARTNRNSGVIELFSGVLGIAPRFGFLTDDGRKADWVIELRTTELPRPQILGSAIGMKVMDKVPWIQGLDQYLGDTLNQTARDYLKDLGAASASNGAVGLFHVENLTPEAKAMGSTLLREDYKTYVIDDEELDRIVNSYPVLWSDPHAVPYRAYIGCPHCSYEQLIHWTKVFETALENAERKTVAVETVICSAPDVIDTFKKTEYYDRLMAMGINLGGLCPLMQMSGLENKPIITNSNKLRTYSSSRYVDDERLVQTVVTGGKL